MFTNYTEIIKVPDNWTDFDNERDELQQYIAEKLDNGEKADKIINIIDNHWSFFAEETAVLVKVEDYDCLTIVDEDGNVNETVYPFDEKQTYYMQKMEQNMMTVWQMESALPSPIKTETRAKLLSIFSKTRVKQER